MRNVIAMCFVIFLLVFSLEARAELSRKDLDEAHQMVYATIYLRTDVLTTNRVKCLTEVSPSGCTKKESSGSYWAFRPNDTVKWGSLKHDGKTIQVWFEGELDELKVVFVQINTLDDFKKAFDHLFSRVPLQDEHPEWPAEVRQAIAERRVIEKLTKEQAACVIGTPLKTEETKEDNANVETWYPRQETGDRRGGRHPRTTGLPKKLKFVNDKLTTIEK